MSLTFETAGNVGFGILTILCGVAIAVALLVTMYYWLLALTALATHKHRSTAGGGHRRRTFAIVVPAHNEERTIIRTIESCKRLHYPADLYELIVVADNCTDTTVDVVKSQGVKCLERVDTANRGKGFALAWGFQQVGLAYDAIVVLDADAELEANALEEFDRHMQDGQLEVLQAKSLASNADNSTISYTAALGSFIENDLFYAPKELLGLSVFLRGTGMVLPRQVLAAFPWSAESAVEDSEYTLRLLRGGVKVRFITSTPVLSEFPATTAQLKVQRLRWIGGTMRSCRTSAMALLMQGVAQRRLLLIDAAWTQFTANRSIIALMVGAATTGSLFCCWLRPGPLSSALAVSAIAILSLQVLYLLLASFLFGFSIRRMQLLVRLPAVVITLSSLAFLTLFGVGQANWGRTPRS